MGPFDKLGVGFSVCGAKILRISKFLASMYVDRPNIFKLMHHGSYLSNLCVLLGPFALKISYINFFFSSLVTEPTNWPPVQDLNPSTPLCTSYSNFAKSTTTLRA
jgi:hypothetical protein